MTPVGWIEVHETEVPKKSTGLIRVKAASIDAVRGYQRGGSTIFVQGMYFHIAETPEEVYGLMGSVLGVGGYEY